ncbi:hypothetical protein [Halobacillus litoralis]|uniref:hypothetical protein n=1 Tax=Halobacillus litoralis TaxID=45668 RepID=UPI00248F7C60|nr:hypothetical protein [Halobacillus litoralis]
MILSILPILIILVVVLMLTITTSKSAKVGLSRGKTGWWMMIGYVVLLLVSTSIFLLLPVDRIDSQEEGSVPDTQSEQLYTHLQEGKTEQIDEGLIVEQWTLDYESDELFLSTPSNDVNGVNIFVEHTESVENAVEATYYQTPMSINGIAIKRRYKPRVDLSEGKLNVYPSETVQIEYKLYEKEFPYKQFSDEKNSGDVVSGWSMAALYIKVPENIEIEADPNTFETVSPR